MAKHQASQKRNVASAGLSCFLDLEAKNKMLKISTHKELETKVAFLELQLESARKNAQFFMEQRNELVMEKLQLIRDKLQQEETNALRMAIIDDAVQNEFPKVFKDLGQMAVEKGWDKVAVSWAGLQTVAEVIHNRVSEVEVEEDTMEAADEQETDSQMEEEGEII